MPARIIEKGLASDGLVIDTIIRKYFGHLPLYRQSVILDRESGVEISRATLDGWVMQVGELLRPLVGVIGRQLKISVRDYLSAVLPGLANVRVQRLPALTPTAWAVQRQ